MEQLYMVEIFIDKVSINSTENESSADKRLIIKVKFGPKVQFIIKEGQMVKNDLKDDQTECDENGQRKWSRTIRVGKSYLFPSYPDTVMMTLSKFPLEIEVWNDDEKEVEIFVGIGTMVWDREFFFMLKETSEPCKRVEPLTIKQKTPLFAECCCGRAGEIEFILRLGSLGDSIITEFQQPMNDPDKFVFRTNRAPSMFECKRIEGEDPNFIMVGSIYETTTLEDPDITNDAGNTIEVCTDLQSCGVAQKDGQTCEHTKSKEDSPKQKSHPIDKIRMGDIVGPCGNTNCALAHKVRTYIRHLDTYKKAARAVSGDKPGDPTKKVCGTCNCKDDRWHRDTCSEFKEQKAVCSGCGGTAKQGETCGERKQKLEDVLKPTPTPSKTNLNNKEVRYLYSVTQVSQCTEINYKRDRIKLEKGGGYFSAPERQFESNQNEFTASGCGCSNRKQLNFSLSPDAPTNEISLRPSGCGCGGGAKLPTTQMSLSDIDLAQLSSYKLKNTTKTKSTYSLGNNPFVYNVSVSKTSQKPNENNCTDIPDDTACKCNPPKPPPPCHTFDCDCITEIGNIESRKQHKPYCPSYKHKANCPVTMANEEEKEEDEVEEAEPLPYGLPPIKLGPCPVMGRPCTVPDGFARMYKTAALAPQPPSYSDAGKVCCSKEYEKIKKAIKDYMKYEKDNDYRCVNRLIADTERRCCDKEQRLQALTGRACCGTHKLAIQEKFKEDKK